MCNVSTNKGRSSKFIEIRKFCISENNQITLDEIMHKEFNSKYHLASISKVTNQQLSALNTVSCLNKNFIINYLIKESQIIIDFGFLVLSNNFQSYNKTTLSNGIKITF